MAEKRARDGVYERKDRKGYWVSFVDHSGRRRQMRAKNAYTLTQAREFLRHRLTEVEQAKLLGHLPPTKDTLATVIPRYLLYQVARLTPKAYERSQGIVRYHLEPAFGHMGLSAIRRGDIERYMTRRLGEVKADTAIKELNVLKHMLGKCVEWELIPFNPAKDVKPPKASPGRLRYLHPGELRALLESCPEWLRPIVGLAVATGMRRGEILGLRWLDVDLKGGRILLPQTKNNTGRIVYINGLSASVIGSLKPGKPTDKVFAGKQVKPSNVSWAFLFACRKAGIEDFRFHDLRHTAASWMRMKGADTHTVAHLLGHKDMRSAARYQHLSAEHLQEAAGLLDGVFAGYLA